MRTIFICIFFSFILPFIAKGENKYVIDSTHIDTSFVEVKHIDADFYKIYKDDSAFHYDENIEQQSDTFWKRLLRNFWHWFFRQLKNANNYYSSLSIVFKLLFWVVIISVVIFLISKLNINRFFYSEKNQSQQTYAISDLDEDIEDLDAAIKQEEQQKNFRKAIRYQFISVLRHLEQNKIIALSDSKTNYDYLKETKKSKLPDNIFGKLVNIYNAIWYGHYDINEADYFVLSKEFIHFKELVNEKK
jgi:hypothetical protein